ncbi:MAG: anhydro-N-acetylmuramic acid kinase [Gammaproteobacteria bacterium]|nr:anhydro-N-acetylmuramic acid kinase [Gammaproteobacteria bacterium]
MNYIGLMSGTSADGIDAVVVGIEQPRTLRLLASHHYRFDDELRLRIQSLMHAGSNELERAALVDTILGERFAQAANAALAVSGLARDQIRAIGSHGQTLRHSPQADPPYTVQIGNPAVIAERTGITTVADFRARDMAAGGQGAPLVPAFHQWLFWQPGRRRIIVNIGGIANVTVLPPDSTTAVTGFDTGPGNALLDRWIGSHRGENYDAGGSWAASGTVDQGLLGRLLGDPFFARRPPKSTGVEHFSLSWIGSQLAALRGDRKPVDVQATLTELTARSIAQAINGSGGGADEVFVCGGGARNSELMRRLQANLGATPLRSTAELGLHPDWVEATAFAWLAHRTLEGLSGNLPSVTGARHEAVLGAVYPA